LYVTSSDFFWKGGGGTAQCPAVKLMQYFVVTELTQNKA